MNSSREKSVCMTHEWTPIWKYNDFKSTLATQFKKTVTLNRFLWPIEHPSDGNDSTVVAINVRKCPRVHPRPKNPRLRVVVVRHVLSLIATPTRVTPFLSTISIATVKRHPQNVQSVTGPVWSVVALKVPWLNSILSIRAPDKHMELQPPFQARRVHLLLNLHTVPPSTANAFLFLCSLSSVLLTTWIIKHNDNDHGEARRVYIFKRIGPFSSSRWLLTVSLARFGNRCT